jgi:hypothetical protein
MHTVVDGVVKMPILLITSLNAVKVAQIMTIISLQLVIDATMGV